MAEIGYLIVRRDPLTFNSRLPLPVMYAEVIPMYVLLP